MIFLFVFHYITGCPWLVLLNKEKKHVKMQKKATQCDKTNPIRTEQAINQKAFLCLETTPIFIWCALASCN